MQDQANEFQTRRHSQDTTGRSHRWSPPRTPRGKTAGDRLADQALDAVVGNLRDSFASMETRLRESQMEIARLEAELERVRNLKTSVSRINVSSLRRQVAMHHHPDVGGSNDLMSRLNAALDSLLQIQSAWQNLAA